MTLIIKSCIHPYDSNPFIVATTDTRMVKKMYNTKTLEFSDETVEMHDDIYDKIIRVSDNVILTTGGVVFTCDPFKEFILERTKKHYFLEDFEPILKEGYNHFMKNGSDGIKKYLNSEYVSVSVLGFSREGTSGEVFLNSKGEVIKSYTPYGSHMSKMFAPTKELSDQQDELLNVNNSPLLESFLERDNPQMLDIYVDHFKFVHSLIASKEVETVSKTCLAHILIKTNEGVHYESHEFDLSDVVEEIKKTL